MSLDFQLIKCLSDTFSELGVLWGWGVSIHLPIHPPTTHPPTHPSAHPSAYLPALHLPIYVFSGAPRPVPDTYWEFSKCLLSESCKSKLHDDCHLWFIPASSDISNLHLSNKEKMWMTSIVPSTYSYSWLTTFTFHSVHSSNFYISWYLSPFKWLTLLEHFHINHFETTVLWIMDGSWFTMKHIHEEMKALLGNILVPRVPFDKVSGDQPKSTRGKYESPPSVHL